MFGVGTKNILFSKVASRRDEAPLVVLKMLFQGTADAGKVPQRVPGHSLATPGPLPGNPKLVIGDSMFSAINVLKMARLPGQLNAPGDTCAPF